jgi:hypothetical protein
MIIVAAVVFLAFVSTSGARPASPYVDVGACPFECCIYRKWHAERTVTLFDRPDGIKIAVLDKGEWIQALSGETHSIPLKIVAHREVRSWYPSRRCFLPVALRRRVLLENLVPR